MVTKQQNKTKQKDFLPWKMELDLLEKVELIPNT